MISSKNLFQLTISLRQCLSSGMTIGQSISILEEQMSSSRTRNVLADMRLQTERGLPLSTALKSHEKMFPQDYISMIEAGEYSGRLEESLTRMATRIERNRNRNLHLASSLVYPGVVACIFLVAVILVLVAFSNHAKSVGADSSNPVVTLVILFLILAGMLAIACIILYYSDSGREFLYKVLRKLPVLKTIIVKQQMADFARNLGDMLGCGLHPESALEYASRGIRDPILLQKVAGAKLAVRGGKSLSEGLSGGNAVSSMILSNLRVGEESGNVDGLLRQAADFHEEEVAQQMRTITVVLPTILLVVVGLILGIAVLGFGKNVLIPNLNV